MPAPLSAFALNCSLKASDDSETSSTDKMLTDLLAELEKHDASGEIVRVLDHDVKPGVLSDMGEGDGWPDLREKIVAADIFVLGTPIWMGQPSSVAKRVLERLDAFLSETDDNGRMPAAGKVALVAVVGNEDGAHHCHAACFQALADVALHVLGHLIDVNSLAAQGVGQEADGLSCLDVTHGRHPRNGFLSLRYI